jgi:hypothetical protein
MVRSAKYERRRSALGVCYPALAVENGEIAHPRLLRTIGAELELSHVRRLLQSLACERRRARGRTAVSDVEGVRAGSCRRS